MNFFANTTDDSAILKDDYVGMSPLQAALKKKRQKLRQGIQTEFNDDPVESSSASREMNPSYEFPGALRALRTQKMGY